MWPRSTACSAGPCATSGGSATSARLLLDGGPGLADRVRELVAAEAECCSFYTFAVAEPDPGTVTLDVTVPPAYVDVLDALTARAATSR